MDKNSEQEEITKAAVARRLGISHRQVINLHGQGIPRSDAGLYLWPAAKEFHDKLLESTKDGLSSARSANHAYEQGRAREKQLKNEKLALDLARIRGELIPADMHEARFAAYVDHVNATLKSLSGKWASRVLGLETTREAQIQLRTLVSELLTELSEVKISANGNGDRSAA